MDLVAARTELHRIAEQVVSPARVAATGNEIALEVRPGGWGTPPFPDGGEVRVEGTELVKVAADGSETREPIDVDPQAATAIADFFALVWGVLAQLDSPEPTHLWPEHFDVATEIGRATYGGSPGDAEHDEPYLYVSVWDEVAPDPLWNATAFRGAELSAPVDRAAALAFFARCRAALER
ncbi:MAG: hypothetical protein ACXVFN_00690 [Solirubrobacteraceae bacterium]